MPADAKTIKAIFLDALDKPAPADRAAFLEHACGGNSDLRRSVEALLKSHESPDALLDQPAVKHVEAQSEEVSLDFLEPSTAPGALGRLGHYDVLEVVGRGGMGIVVRAFDQKLRRVVAIKVLAPALAENGEARQRFVREARAAAAVTHQNVIAIHGVEDTGPVPYLVMQYIDGKTLQQKLDATGSLELKEILRIGLQVAEGLAAAHRHGLVHRDIKPANILLENGIERVKITDFGLARTADDASLTQSGYIAGTPLFMSPEQARGEHVDHRTDLFSLGTVLYAMCAGHPPFRANSSMAVLKRVCDDAPRPLREINPAVPEWLEAIVERLHQKDPAARFATAQEVVGLLSRGLNQVQTGAGPNTTLRGLAPRRRVRRGRWVAAIVAPLAIVGVAIAAWQLTRKEPGKTTDPPPEQVTAPQPWQPRAPLTAEELAKLTDPLDDWRREDMPEGTQARLRGDLLDAVPEFIGLLGDGPFRFLTEDPTHWPVGSPDGRLLAIGFGTRVVLFDTETGAVVRFLTGHAERAFRGSFSSDGKRYACGAMDGKVRVWNVEDGKEEPKAADASPASTWCVQFAPGDKQLVVADSKGMIRVWDFAAGPELKRFGEHKDGCHHFRFSPDGTRIASGGFDGHVKIWSWPDGALLATSLQSHSEKVMSIAYSADGALLASGSASKVLVWDAATFKLLKPLRTSGDGLLAFTPDGQTVLTAPHFSPAFPSQERAFSRWDVNTGDAPPPLPVPGLKQFLVGDLSKDGRTVYLMTCDPAEPCLGAYDADTGKERFPGQRLARGTGGIAFSPDGRWLASAGSDGRVCLWDLARHRAGEYLFPDRQLEGHTREALSVAFSPDGQILASGGKDAIRFWQVANGQELHRLTGHGFPLVRLAGHLLPFARMAFSADGETLAAVGMDDGVDLWNVKTGKPDDTVRWHAGPTLAVAFSADGRWLASGGADKTVQLIDRASGQREHRFQCESAVTGVTFSPDSKTLSAICAGPDPFLLCWDVATKKAQTAHTGHTMPVIGIGYHPTGNWIATASMDRTVRLWDSAPGTIDRRKFDFRGLGIPVATAFSPSGRHFAVGLDNGTIAILKTPDAVGHK